MAEDTRDELEIEIDRQKNLWVSVASNYAGSVTGQTKEGAVNWANHILDGYLKRFKEYR